MPRVLPEYTEMFSAWEAKERTIQSRDAYTKAELEDAYKEIANAVALGCYSTSLHSPMGEISKSTIDFLEKMGFEVITGEKATFVTWEYATKEERN